jgi:hypothetical protein
MFHAAREWADNPAQRSNNQSYVMAIWESPPHSEHNLDRDRGFFNRSMTYRLDSDIRWPYAIVVDIATREQVAPLPGKNHPKWRMPEDDFLSKPSIFVSCINRCRILLKFQIKQCWRLHKKKQKWVHGLCQTVKPSQTERH